MHEHARKIADLISKYLYGHLDEEGARELDCWKQESTANQELFDRLTSGELLKSIHDSAVLEKQIFSKIENKIQSGERGASDGSVKKLYWRWLVAASVVLLVGIGSYFSFFNDRVDKGQVAANSGTATDVAPGSYKAKLQLADGSVIILDSAALGELAKQGNVAVKNVKGQLVYDAQGKNAEVLYNTLSTSTGESYSTLLADGSRLWLNSGSSVKYPVTFVDNERVIEASGEIFLEVAIDAKRPFKVQVLQGAGKRCEVQVLGTSFNVMAYSDSDESQIETTLVEGKIAFTTGNTKKFLIPGQQAVLNSQGTIEVMNDVNTEMITAWKNQDFYFKSNDLKTIMRYLARWYGIEVEYKGR